MLEQFINALNEAGLDLDDQDLADIFWLATKIDKLPSKPEPLTSIEPKPNPPPKPNPKKVNDSNNIPEQLPDKDPIPVYPAPFPKNNPVISLQPGSTPIKVPAATALPHSLALARSLRPLMRKVPSLKEKIIDEEATVKRIAEENIWLPALKHSPTRWLELALVVEESNSVIIWQQTIAELRQLLGCQGAFRDVRTWGLKTDTEGNMQVFAREGTNASKQKLRSYRELIDPTGRRLILIVTDCISSAWYQGAIYQLLREWSKNCPVTILQLLPEKLWMRTALGLGTAVQLRSLIPGVANAQLLVDGLEPWEEEELDLASTLKIPVVTLESKPLHLWSQVIAGVGNVSTAGFVIESINSSNIQLSNQTQQLSASHRVSLFHATASGIARRLAGLMAAAPVSFPVVRLIQKTMLPCSEQVHLAEVFMSGLLDRLSPVSQENNPDYIQYEFHSGVRELLLQSLPKSESIDVIQRISEYVAEGLGLSVKEFQAVLIDPKSGVDTTTKEKALPFARITAQVLRRLGGEYRRFAEKIEETTLATEKEINSGSSESVDLTRLQDFLSAKRWQDADLETTRLILQAATATQGRIDWLDLGNMHKLPCDLLRTIDQLWLSYSQGRFGFSVQKQIYLNIDDKSNTREKNKELYAYSPKIWQAFGDRIGWLRSGDWINDRDFTFSLDAPEGHLPSWIDLLRLNVWGYRKGRINRFLALLKECNLECEAVNTTIQLQKFEFEVITVDRRGETIKTETKSAQYFPENLGNNINLDMVYIPGGKFVMGAPESEKGSSYSERPRHIVTIQTFYMGKYPITQAQWQAVVRMERVLRDLKVNPSRFEGDDLPVEKVSWYDAVEFCARLSRHTGRDYRLPFEAEWEYACRAGTATPFHFGATITGELAHYDGTETYADEPAGEYRKKTVPVKSFSPNIFGLYNMHGNIWEWCANLWHENYQGAPEDSHIWDEIKNNYYYQKSSEHLAEFLKDDRNRVVRGGSWNTSSRYCRSAFRGRCYPVVTNFDYGFRVVCDVPIKLQTFQFEVVTVNSKGEEIKREARQARYFRENLDRETSLDMISIPGGKFMMGSPKEEKHSKNDERPQHQVTVPSFYMSKYPITQAQWRTVAKLSPVNRQLKPDPSFFKGNNRPVEQVSWYDAVEFCDRLSRYTGKEYRLPSEAEWEYACRAGTITPFYFGETITSELANYLASNAYINEPKGTYRREITPIGSFPPNSFGLYGMHGNVWEWCMDHWHRNYHWHEDCQSIPLDGSAWIDFDDDNQSKPRLLRGGSWCDTPENCRSACRYFDRPNLTREIIGFRIVCIVSKTTK
ncbi:MAG: SAV_2336 N-terminal domain-related protein [Waterburya sp.]